MGSRGRNKDPFVPPEPLELGRLDVTCRRLSDIAIPQEVVDSVVPRLTNDYGLRPSMAEAMVQEAAAIRRWLYPLASELKPGQLLWMAHSTQGPRRDEKCGVPAVLTLLRPDQASASPNTRDDLRRLKLAKIERITTEACCQDAVLTSLDLEWLLGVSQSLLRQLLDAYQEEHGGSPAHGRDRAGYGFHTDPQDHRRGTGPAGTPPKRSAAGSFTPTRPSTAIFGPLTGY